MPVPLERFEELVADALDTLPAELAKEFRNVVVLVEDMRPGQPNVLGLYEGHPLTERRHYTFALPDRITLFRLPLCRVVRDEAALTRQIAVTVVHEFAHHMGIDDARLHELGWG
ncbi:MAG: metallopeptidase family protein [Mycobacteriales bacterium]